MLYLSRVWAKQTGACVKRFDAPQRNCVVESRQLGAIQDSNPFGALFESTPNQANRITSAGMLAVFSTINSTALNREISLRLIVLV